MLKTKVGYSTLKDSYAKGKEAAKNANVGMRPKLGMMYCSCNDDVEEVVSGAMSSMKGAPIIGCTSTGMIITNDGIIESEDGFAGLMSFDDKNMNIGCKTEVPEDAYDRGRTRSGSAHASGAVPSGGGIPVQE